MKLRSIVLPLLALILVGCVTIEYQEGDKRLRYTSFGKSIDAEGLRVKTPNVEAEVAKGKSDSTHALEALNKALDRIP